MKLKKIISWLLAMGIIFNSTSLTVMADTLPIIEPTPSEEQTIEESSKVEETDGQETIEETSGGETLPKEDLEVEPSSEADEPETEKSASYDVETESIISETVTKEGLSFNSTLELSEESTSIVASGICGENLTWTLTEDGVLTISGEGKMEDYTSSGYVPWYDCRKQIHSVTITNGVSTVGDHAFSMSNLTAIELPESITAIGDYAFYYCRNLSNIVLPDGVISIGNYAFYYCTALESVYFSSDLTVIGDYTFYCCFAIENISIPNGVTTIGDDAFNFCNNLSDITLPNSLTTIGSFAFDSCSSLSNVYYNGSNSQWNRINVGSYNDFLLNANIHCEDPSVSYSGTCGENLTWVLYSDGVLTISGTGIMDNYTVSNTRIGPNAPWNSYQDQIIDVVIEDGVASIGENAFYGYESLANITFPLNSLRSIEWQAFDSCTHLKSVEIPDSVTNIAQDAFADCTGLSSVKISNKVTEINVDTFRYCTNLTDIVIPDRVNIIWNQAFYACSSLQTVYLPSSITCIGNEAFYDCGSLTDVYYNSTEEDWNKIDIAWTNEDLLNADIHFAETNETPAKTVLDLYSTHANMTVPTNLVYNGDSQSLVLWTFYNGEEPINFKVNGVLSNPVDNPLGKDAGTYTVTYWVPESNLFYAVPETTITVTIAKARPMDNENPNGYGFNWDWDNSVYETVYNPNGIELPAVSISLIGSDEKITPKIFYRKGGSDADYIEGIPSAIGCYELLASWEGDNNHTAASDILIIEVKQDSTNIIIDSGTCGENLIWELDEDGVLTISGTGDMDNYMVENAPWSSYRDKIQQANIKTGVTTIGAGAFYNCFSLSKVSLPNTLLSIEVSAFEKTALTEISIPNSVTTIAQFAFSSCTTLSKVFLPNSLTTLGIYAFKGTALQEIVLPTSLTKIDSYTFYACKNIKEVTISKSITSISQSAFDYCTSLTDIYYGGTEDDWAKITIGTRNDYLASAIIHFTDPTYTYTENTDGTLTLTGYTGELVGDVILPSEIDGKTVTAIYGAFNYQNKLTSAVIPDTVTSIRNVFNYCDSLKTVTIPESVVKIANGDDPFRGCDALEEFILTGENNIFTFENGMLCLNNEVLHCVKSVEGEVTVPEGTTFIKHGAFWDCVNITVINIPATVSGDEWRLYIHAFEGCTSLTTINYAGTEAQWNVLGVAKNVPEGVTVNCTGVATYTYTENTDGTLVLTGYTGELVGDVILPSEIDGKKVKIIGYQAFKNQNRIEYVVVPNTVTHLWGEAFANCSSLKKVELPYSLMYLYKNVFDACTALTNIIYTGTEYSWNTQIINSIEAVPENVLVSFTGSPKWTYAAEPNGICITGYTGQFPEAVVIPKSIDGYNVVTIGYNAFRGQSKVKSITIPNTICPIYSNPFMGCTAIEEFILEEGSVFWFEDGVLGYTQDEISAVYSCIHSKQGMYEIPDGVQKIAAYAFSDCVNLTSVKLPKSVEEIRAAAFSNCSSLVDIYYGGTPEEWALIEIGKFNEAFQSATVHFTEVIIENIVNVVGDINVTEPFGGWKEGSNTFTVSCDKACYVAVSYDGGETYTRLPATASGNAYSFTADDVDANTIITVGVLGDVNGNGRIDALDARQIVVAITNAPDALKLITLDVNGNGRPDALDARKVVLAITGSPFTW